MDLIPKQAPEPSPISLITMTVNFDLNVNFNLTLIASSVELDDVLVGVKFEDISRGKADSNKKKKTSGKDFKNQCTFNLLIPDEDEDSNYKKVNVKLFNNGKMALTGCKKTEHVEFAVSMIVDRIHKLNAYLEYYISDEFKNYSIDMVFRKEILPYRELIHILAYKMEININCEPFNPALNTKEASKIFNETYQKMEPGEIETVNLLLTIINILKSYYGTKIPKTWQSTDDLPEYIDKIISAWNPDERYIADIFPSYLNNDEKIKCDFNKIVISNINSKLDCYFPINREMVTQLLKDHPSVDKIDFDEDRYSGVNVKYDTGLGRKVTIIFFNSGKVNISSAKNIDQINQSYKFVTEFCRDNFKQLLMVSKFIEDKKRELNELPDQYPLGEFEGEQYILLKKNAILRNPRNVFLLKNFGLLAEYQ